MSKVHTLGDYIKIKEQQILNDDEAVKAKRKAMLETQTEYERGYMDGWHDAHVKIKAGE